MNEPACSRERLARLAAEYAVRSQPGTGRYAAVVAREGRRELVRSDQLAELFGDGSELIALVNLELVFAER